MFCASLSEKKNSDAHAAGELENKNQQDAGS
jgi:hypothetical protein